MLYISIFNVAMPTPIKKLCIRAYNELSPKSFKIFRIGPENSTWSREQLQMLAWEMLHISKNIIMKVENTVFVHILGHLDWWDSSS